MFGTERCKKQFKNAFVCIMKPLLYLLGFSKIKSLKLFTQLFISKTWLNVTHNLQKECKNKTHLLYFINSCKKFAHYLSPILFFLHITYLILLLKFIQHKDMSKFGKVMTSRTAFPNTI